ncbi:hypothetical protein Y032_0038g3596 [Ancylostoma ceylanicum]|uniref:Uncharacterized protein n=1 Tax=Ancylostoma ceylanicum TaxID=53326 RepID=A0A016UJJ2_9BILA|nr:hypothetical protein Y032_0038g3596 [Ancylostoma ceylanicum]
MINDAKGFSDKGYGVHGNRRAPLAVDVKNMRGSSMLRERRHLGARMRVVKDHNVAKTHIAPLNVGTLTCRSCELAAALEDRRIDLCAVEETRWSGNKSKDNRARLQVSLQR